MYKKLLFVFFIVFIISACGLEAFTYQKNGKTMHISYYQAPEEALEDSEIMSTWANKSYAVALRAAAKKRNKEKKP